jgi:hypothetical protein
MKNEPNATWRRHGDGMATVLRFMRPSAADDEQPRQDDELRQVAEEGGDPGAAGDMPGFEEGDTPAVDAEVSAVSGTEPVSKDDSDAVDVHSIARVRRWRSRRSARPSGCER